MAEKVVAADIGKELQCPDVGCKLGEDGGRYKTEKMDKRDAF